MRIAIDLGGSTIDIVAFRMNDEFSFIASFESVLMDKSDPLSIITKANVDLAEVEAIALTGGHSRIFASELSGIPVYKVAEIEAIGKGGAFLADTENALVCSLGTGTCCVSARDGIFRHVGGTGIGGGSLLGLGKTLLDIPDFKSLQSLITRGESKNIDLSVAEIVGGGIGVVPGSATAANFAKADANSSREDIARGIANLVGQTIASIAIFAARAEQHDTIVLGGKLIRVPQIVEIIERTASIYARKIIVPEHAELLSAVGAGLVAFC